MFIPDSTACISVLNDQDSTLLIMNQKSKICENKLQE